MNVHPSHHLPKKVYTDIIEVSRKEIVGFSFVVTTFVDFLE